MFHVRSEGREEKGERQSNEAERGTGDKVFSKEMRAERERGEMK